ncbi:hypothetical protein BaRGS_00003054, partial [Batillaria attramentaria]
ERGGNLGVEVPERYTNESIVSLGRHGRPVFVINRSDPWMKNVQKSSEITLLGSSALTIHKRS